VFNGFKNFNTGGVVSDLTVLEGVLDGTEDHIFTFVNTVQPGIQFAHNWDSIGLRLSESGSVKLDNIKVPWTDALGWNAQTKRPISGILGIPFASLLLPTIQLVFSNFYLGIAQGSLAAATKYTNNSTRAWPYGGDNKDKAIDEWYILERYGTYRAYLQAADALADRAGAEVAALYREAGQHGSSLLADASKSNSTNGTNGINGHIFGDTSSGTRSSITAQRRGEVATLVASVKIVTTDTGLQVTNGIFEMLGARATGKKYGFDRFWRDIRTHTLHDPVAYKKREVGRYQLLQEIPEPTWYT
jgi:alkylation response protein AidB-like acyl-CoA dehydrogenase